MLLLPLLLACTDPGGPDSGRAGTDGGAVDTGDGGSTDGGADTGDPAAPSGLVPASAGLRLLGVEPGAFAGYAVARVGDVDGDGVADLWTSASRASATQARGGAAYLVLGPVTADGSLGDAALVLRGESNGWLGTSLDGAGDQDGDGREDLLAGAPDDMILEPVSAVGAGPGRAVLVSGAARGTVAQADALAVLIGEVEGDKAGSAVARAGDLSGDGLDDVLVGATMHEGTVVQGGAAYLVEGPVAGLLSLQDAGARLLGTVAGEQAGGSLQALGDVTGDGYGDLLVGADGDERGLPGRAYLVPGPLAGSAALADVAHAILLGTEVDDNLAATALGGADLDGDDLPDYLLCAYDADLFGQTMTGAAYLLRGPLAGTVLVQEEAASTLQGVEGMGHAAEACALVGDLDSDGRTDFALGAHEQGKVLEGRAYLFTDTPAGTSSMGQAQAIVEGAVAGDDLGWSVAGAGDLTGDGFDDLLLGARMVSESEDAQGAVYILRGGR